MKKIIFFFIFVFQLCHSFGEIPTMTLSRVSDPDNFLSKEEQIQLNKDIEIYEKNSKTGSQIAVFILKNPLDELSNLGVEYGRALGVGAKDKNNGIVILLAPTKGKIFISTGYGIEGVLTDTVCTFLAKDAAKKYFSKKQYFKGLQHLVYNIRVKVNSEKINNFEETQTETITEIIPIVILGIPFFIVLCFIVYDIKTSKSFYHSNTAFLLNSFSSDSYFNDSYSNDDSFGGGSFGGGGGGASF